MKANKLKKLVSVAFAFCVAALYAELPDPLVWFKMDALNENGGVDSVGTVANKTLTLTGGITLVDDDEMGKVLEFAGGASDRGNFSCPALSSRTISLWFWRDLTEGELTTGNNPYFFQGLSGSGLNWYKDDCDLTFVQSGISAINGNAVSRGSWHHVAITIDVAVNPAAINIYVDGVCVRSASASATLPVATQESDAYVGNSTGAMGRPFKGRMFDLRVYDLVLTGAQVGELAADGLAKRGPCLVSRWPFETIVDGMTPEVTGRGTSLTLGSGMSLVPDGVDGKALRFYSANAVGLGATSKMPAVDLCGHTWTCWIRRSSKSPELNVVSENPYPRFIVLDKGTFIQLADSSIVNGRDIAVNPNRKATGTTVTSANFGMADSDVWGHLAVVIRVLDGTSSSVSAKADVYLNGEKVSMSKNNAFSCENSFTVAYDPFCLGNAGIGRNRYFCGDMDDLRLYDCALSDDEVRRVYRGLAKISAGIDFTTTTEKATLRGCVDKNAGNGLTSGYAGKTIWTLVSAPVGGESAAIGNPLAPETSVTLPVNGAYVFRLTITDLGVSKSDDVTVTRMKSVFGNEPPSIMLDETASVAQPEKLALVATVSDSDNGPGALRVCWAKKSGPGGVWFEPDNSASTTADFSVAGTYVLTCTAEDGQDRTSAEITVTVTGGIDGSTIKNGLENFWKLNAADGTSRAGDDTAPHSAWTYTEGVEGLSAAALGHKTYFNTGATSFPGEASGTFGTLTISAWVYVDETHTTNLWYRGAIIGKRNTFAIRYKDKCCGSWGPQVNGFTIYQQGDGGSFMLKHYLSPVDRPPEGRWMHICAVIDRAAGTAMEMWFDGVKQTEYVDPTPSYNTGVVGGRHNANAITLCGEPYAEYIGIGGNAWNNFNINYPSSGNTTGQTESGKFYSNSFPGKIDNVGIWNRKLSDGEIRYLAAHPDMNSNRGASLDVAAPAAIVKKESCELSVNATADLVHEGRTLSYAWEVVSENAEKATFDDAASATPKMTVSKSGVYSVQVSVSDGERVVYSRIVDVNCPMSGCTVSIR